LRKNLRVIVILLCLAAFHFSYLEAATLRINPTKIRLAIPPGESRSGVIEVENPSDQTIVVKSYLQDWAYTSLHDGTKEFFASGTTGFSASGWISTSLSEFVIPAYGKQNINYTVKVPAKAEGGHFAVLFFESLLSGGSVRETQGLGVMVRIGALFYIEPQNTIKHWAEISNLNVQKKSPGPLELSLDFKNTGNIDITAQGTFHIMDKTGMVLARGDFNDCYTLPQESAKLQGAWKEILPKGEFDLVVTLDIGKARQDAGLGRGPVITKEAKIQFDENGNIVKVGELR
jgi:hypothetical protein